MSSEQWIAEEFVIEGVTFPIKVSPPVYRRRGAIWGAYSYFGKDTTFNLWQEQIGQFYEYGYAELPQYMLNCPCVYILYHNDEVVYVGQTKKLYGRIRGHFHKEYNYAQIIYCAEFGLRSRIEQFLIETYAPIYNRDFNPDPYSKALSLVDYEKEFTFIHGKRWRNHYNKLLFRMRERHGVIELYNMTKKRAEEIKAFYSTNPA